MHENTKYRRFQRTVIIDGCPKSRSLMFSCWLLFLLYFPGPPPIFCYTFLVLLLNFSSLLNVVLTFGFPRVIFFSICCSSMLMTQQNLETTVLEKTRCQHWLQLFHLTIDGFGINLSKWNWALPTWWISNWRSISCKIEWSKFTSVKRITHYGKPTALVIFRDNLVEKGKESWPCLDR